MLNNNGSFIHVENVIKNYRYGKNIDNTALSNVNLNIKKGEFICLLGPSGCGKTTLLNLIAGFEKPTSGSIRVNGVEVNGTSSENITIFQNFGLLPWRTVEKNVELGLEAKNIKRKERKEIVHEYLKLVGLADYAKCHPYQLSGGMKQRVAIARALAVDPEIIFMDEPFGSLDAMTRMNMQEEIISIWEQKKKTIIFVTHDIDESIYLADRIVVMTPCPGKIKSIIDVPLSRKRCRTDPDFILIRDRVFSEFNMVRVDDQEYQI